MNETTVHPAEPVVTAMMLVRDRATMLDVAARSVLAQQGMGEHDLELVIVDDGSVDGTPHVTARLAQLDQRVRVIRNERSQGIPVARNQALAAARGRYLATCDSDDVALPGRFAAQLELLEGDGALVGAGTRFRAFDHGTDPDGGTEPGWHWGLADGRLPFLFPTAMLRTDAVRAAGGFDESFPLAEDLELCYRLAARGGRFATVDEVLVAYRLHAGSITRSRARAREWHNLRAQLRGARLMRGRLTLRGWLVIGQSALRTLLAAAGVRR